MNAFTKHGIQHLSASSLNLWRANLSLWAFRYLAGHKDDDSPAVWRGRAVEDGLTALLRGHDPAGVALNTFELNARGDLSDDVDAERKLVPQMVAQLSRWKPPGELVAAQLKIEHWFDGVPVPVIGYIDYVFEDGTIVDCKTTKACPSSPKADHARQIAIYRAARGNAPGSLLYVTHAKHACYPVSDVMAAECLAELRRDALSLEAFLARVDSAEDALHLLPFNTDDFRINEATKSAYNAMMGV